MKKLLKKFSVLALVLTMVFGFGSAAYADSAYVGGELDRSGSRVRYNTMRTHTFNGPIGLNVDDMPDGYLRLGLRNMKKPGGPQFTDSIQWNHCEYRQWDNILKGTKFAFQGRMKPTGSWFADYKWGEHLTF